MSLFERRCAVCKAPIEGRKDRRTCGDRCRTALKRAESNGEAVTSAGAPVTAAGWASDEPDDPLDHWQAVPEW